MVKQAIEDTSVVLSTQRMNFRCLCLEDLVALRAILGDPLTMHAWGYGFSDEQIAEWIARNCVLYPKGYGYYAAFERITGMLIGMMGPLPEEIEGVVHTGLGYILHRGYWGRGYALEGATAWLHHCFAVMGAQRVIAEIRPENTASCRVAERLGMQVEGETIKLHEGQQMRHLIYAVSK